MSSKAREPDNEAQPQVQVDPPRELSIHPTESPPGLRLVGDISRGQSGQLADALADASPGSGEFTLDLAGVTFMDSIGMHVIAHAAAEHDPERLILDSPVPWVHKVLLLGGTDKLPNVHFKKSDA